MTKPSLPKLMNLSGNQLLTAKITLTKDQWALLSILARHSIPTLPGPTWESLDYILETLDTEITQAVESD